ncbi:hypothetical protein GCM10027291_52060 [Telluribacter humicola]
MDQNVVSLTSYHPNYMADLVKHPTLEEFVDLSMVNAVLPDTNPQGQSLVVFLQLKKSQKKQIIWEFESQEIRNHFLLQLQQ